MKANLTINKLFKEWNFINTILDSRFIREHDLLIDPETGIIDKAKSWAKNLILFSHNLTKNEKIEKFTNLIQF